MPLTMFGAGSSVTVAPHLPDGTLWVANARGANRAVRTGADGPIVIGPRRLDLLVLRKATARDKKVKKPALIAGGVTANNLRETLLTGDGVMDQARNA